MTVPLLISDETVRAVPAVDAVDVMRETIAAHGRGDVMAPPRIHAALGSAAMTFTVGATPDVYGFRSYDSLDGVRGQQLVVVHDRASGDVRCLSIGHALGPIRTGAIGGAAVDAMTPDADVPVLGVIGTGIQAYRQIWAISAVRRIGEVRIYSRDAARRAGFAARVAGRFGLATVAADSAQDAVREASVVTVATNSTTPVLRSEWLRDDVHVNLLGPKADDAAEYPAELTRDAEVVATDSPAQLRDYGVADAELDRTIDLGTFLAAGRTPVAGRSVFHSVGLAGTEVALLAAIAAANPIR